MPSAKPIILIAPLNWGLGHATRCVPIIRELLNNHCEPVICGNGNSFLLLQKEFPKLKHIELPDFSIHYTNSKNLFFLTLLRQLPRFFLSMHKDKLFAKKIITQTKPVCIISDNRYGFRHSSVYCVLLTHQIKPLLPKYLQFFSKFFYAVLFGIYKKFNEIWVPDSETEPSLSGILSHNTSLNLKIKYCGPISRFSPQLAPEPKALKYDILAILSGPEPFRTQLEKQIFNLVSELEKKICIVAGQPNQHKHFIKNNITFYSHLGTKDLQNLILESDILITNAGYSTLMDLTILQKKALIVPTPGQTEQEYLAQFHNGKGLFLKFDPLQDNLDSAILLLKSQKNTSYNSITYNLSSFIGSFVNTIQ